MTTRKRAKVVILPQFPFLFPSALVCFLFPVSRRGKLETKVVSWAVLPMKMPLDSRETKALKNRLSFHDWRFHQFPFLFPFHARSRR
jgi:hypothetical protein